MPSGISTSIFFRLWSARAQELQHAACGLRAAAPAAPDTRNSPRRYRAVSESSPSLINRRNEPSIDHMAAVLAGARPQIENVVRGAHHSGSCSTTRIVLPRSRSSSRMRISRPVSRVCSPIDGSSRRSRRPPGANPGKWRAGCAAPRRPKAWTRGGRASDSRVPHRSGISAAAGSRPGSSPRWRSPPARVPARRKIVRLGDVHAHHIGDILAGHAHVQRLLAQPRAVAIRTPRIAAVAAQEHPHVQLVFLFPARRRTRAADEARSDR